jgi:ketosteroid isomerase-like protein
MEVDLPEIVAEVEACFAAYETALMANDVDALTAMFSDLPQTIRYGINENLYGTKEIHAFRAGRSGAGLSRTLSRTVISTYGRDFAIASTLFDRSSAPGKIGRQMQSWARMPQGWRIVAAHVSMIDKPA